MLGSGLVAAVRLGADTLEAVSVPYALVGGLAATLRGRLRSTRDCDVLVLAETSQLDRLKESLRAAGFAHMDRADRHRLDEVTLYRFWYPVESSGFSLSLDLQVGGNDFHRQVIDRSGREQLGDFSLKVATSEDLILLKLLAWRPIDRADAIDLVSLASELDRTYLTEWAARLSVAERLAELPLQ